MKLSLLTLILLLTASCAQHTLTPEDRCDINSIHKSAEWWVCVNNEDMLDNQISLTKEIKEAQAQRLKSHY